MTALWSGMSPTLIPHVGSAPHKWNKAKASGLSYKRMTWTVSMSTFYHQHLTNYPREKCLAVFPSGLGAPHETAGSWVLQKDPGCGMRLTSNPYQTASRLSAQHHSLAWGQHITLACGLTHLSRKHQVPRSWTSLSSALTSKTDIPASSGLLLGWARLFTQISNMVEPLIHNYSLVFIQYYNTIFSHALEYSFCSCFWVSVNKRVSAPPCKSLRQDLCSSCSPGHSLGGRESPQSWKSGMLTL